MLAIYERTEHGLAAASTSCDECWIHAEAPGAEDIAALRELGIQDEWLSHVLDVDERARVEFSENIVFIVLRLPYASSDPLSVPFVTLPLTILLKERLLVTITLAETGLLHDLIDHYLRSSVSTINRGRLVLELLRSIAHAYQARLREINASVDQLEDQLQRSLRNREVLQLLKYQKSLLYFTTALRSNELVIRQLQSNSLLDLGADDAVLLADVLVEIHQAMEMSDVSQNILSQMMDAFASIISNNLNVVMKFLASITIIISLPTLIASLYGMNVLLPGSQHPLAFTAIVVVSVLVSLLVSWIFWKRHLF